MRFFHVSENDDIQVFYPRFLERRRDIDQGNGLIWAVTLDKVYNFFFPENCPRLSTFKGKAPNYLSEHDPDVCAYIHKDWYDQLKQCRLTIYEFDSGDFELQDEIAGYYVSQKTQKPIEKYHVKDCLKALEAFDVTLHIINDLEKQAGAIMHDTHNYSFRKMKK